MSPIDQIKQKLDIVEFIGQYVTLKKAGRNFKAVCPFHQEKSPSFVISPERQIWHCFGSCGTGGDIVSFWMKWENLSFHDALVELAERAGVQLTASSYQDEQAKQKERLLSINNLAERFYSYILTKTAIGAHAREYLAERGISEKIIHTFGLGYAPQSWDSLVNWFQKKNISNQDLEEAGLVIKSQNTNRYYDRFRNRIVFPIKDAKGATIGFSGRILKPDAKSAKYVNTPETPLYHKRESLYGINITRDAIRKAENVYIVEGEFDLITPYMHGVDTIVAIKGSALTPDQLAILKRYTNKLTLALDTDEAGIEAMKRGIREAEKLDFEIYVVQFTHGKDPDEAARTDLVSFKKDLQNPLPIYDFLLTHFRKKYSGDSPFQKKKIGDEMAPYLGHIRNPIVLSHYVKKLAHFLDVDTKSVEKLIWTERNHERSSFRSKYLTKPVANGTQQDGTQRYLLSYILQQDQKAAHIRAIFSVIEPEDFWIPSLQNVSAKFRDYIDAHQTGYTFSTFIQTLPAELQSVADEVFLYASSEIDLKEADIAELIYKFKKHSYQYFLAKYAKDENDEKVAYYNKKLHDLSKSHIAKQLQTV